MRALARSCAPWGPDAGEKEKNALPRGHKAFRYAALWDEEAELGAGQGILFLLAWQLFAVQKACQSPHPRRAGVPGFLMDMPPDLGCACRGFRGPRRPAYNSGLRPTKTSPVCGAGRLQRVGAVRVS